MKFIRTILRFPETIAYMLQSTEYEAGAYIRWFWRTRSFGSVMNRRELDATLIARVIKLFVGGGMILEILGGVYLMIVGTVQGQWAYLVMGGFIIVAAPVVWAHLVLVATTLARMLVIEPRRNHQKQITQDILTKHKGITIAIAGSYGKTTMKEILATILAEGMKVAATPANKNVAVSHYQFALNLDGDEAALVIEYGEGKPGDVRGFAQTTIPDIGIITGLAPAHLDRYGSVHEAGKDIFALADYLQDSRVYVNEESALIRPFVKPTHTKYSRKGAGEWRVSGVQVSIDGTVFSLSKGARSISVETKLIGAHLVGTLAAAAKIALELGMTDDQLRAGIAKTMPYEHRMQPYYLGGAWVIDDAYNGNLEGIRAGTDLLRELEAKRKIYVTPGLVDQGDETEAVHNEVGRLIAGARPDVVVLMKNSVTEFIVAGLNELDYGGELRLENEPLRFYTHLDQIAAVGDIVMLQNDWTDNYY